MLVRKKYPFIKDLLEDSGFLMLQVSSLWADYRDRVLKKYYLISHMQFSILASVYWFNLHNEKQITQTMLARCTRISPMTISQILKVLVSKGYIYRTTHLTDARAKSVGLTDSGKDLMDKAVETIYDVDTKFFSILSKNVKHFNHYMVELLNANDVI